MIREKEREGVYHFHSHRTTGSRLFGALVV